MATSPCPESSDLPKQTKPVVQDLKKKNLEQWRIVTNRIEKWKGAAGTAIDTIVCMRLSPQGQIQFCGSDHMKQFVEETAVQFLFKKHSQSRSISFAAVKTQAVERCRIQLPNRTPHMWYNSDLRKLISEYVNPKRQRKFWIERNKPEWWPEDIPFASPNGTRGNDRPAYSQLVVIAEAMMNRHESDFTYKSDDNIVQETDPSGVLHGSPPALVPDFEDADCNEAKLTRKRQHADDGTSSPLLFDEPVKPLDLAAGNKQFLQPIKIIPDPVTDTQPVGKPAPKRKRVLKDSDVTKFTIELSTCVSWMDFLSKASEIWMSGKIQEAINTAGVNPGTLQEDKRYSRLKDLPMNCVAGNSTGNGNCLFNSISILLWGSESKACWLRLGAAVWGALHHDHYLQMLSACLHDQNAAYAFMVENCSSDIVESILQPCAMSKLDLLRISLQEEAKRTQIEYRYSSKLQVQYLAGVLQRPIEMFCEGHCTGYEGLVHPCPCFQGIMVPPLQIMWVFAARRKRFRSSCPNHIIPLASSAVECDMACGYQNEINWVQCIDCKKWGHCRCIGLPQCVLTGTESFSCCNQDNCSNTIIVNYPSRQVKGHCALSIRTVSSLLGSNFIDGEIIDFGSWLANDTYPSQSFAFLSYKAWQKVSKSASITKQTLDSIKRTLTCSRGADSTIGYILPICRLSHWILAVLVPNRIWLVDSMNGALERTLADLVEPLKKLHTALKLASSHQVDVSNLRVPQQKNGYDCGAHVLKHIWHVHEVHPKSDAELRSTLLATSMDNVGSSMRSFFLEQIYQNIMQN